MGGIHEGHRARMKQKLLDSGERSLADHELLEVLLYYAIPRRDTNELAHRLLKQFGSLQGVLSASVQELACVQGVGQQAALLISLVPMLRRRAAQSAKEQILNSVDACGAYFTELLGGSRREMLWQVCLDGKGKVLSSRCLAEGDVSMAAVSVRQVVEYALHAGAVGVVLAHNHPSGVALPSQEDIATTRFIRDALRTMNIQLVDHIVVADTVNENIPVKLKGKDISIAFNGKYISEYLKIAGEDFINLNLNSAIDPCILTPVGNDSFIYLVLPVRINA